MNTEDKPRSVSLKKAISDSARLREFAWACVVLNEQGDVESVVRRSPNAGTPFIGVIAILGPATVCAEDGSMERISCGVLTEIGLQKGRPFTQQKLRAEWNISADCRPLSVPPRQRVGELPFDLCRKVQPVLEDLFFHYVVERLQRWKHVERRWAGNFPSEPGVRFTLSRFDIHFVRWLLREDWWWRQTRFFFSRGQQLERILRRLHIDRSTDRMIRANSVANEAATFLRGLLPLERSFLRREFQVGSTVAGKLHHICDVFNIHDADQTDDGKLLFGDPKVPYLPCSGKVHFFIPRRNGKKQPSLKYPQGKNTIVGEVFLDKDERLKIFPDSATPHIELVRAEEDRRERAAIQEEAYPLDDSCNDDDIPF